MKPIVLLLAATVLFAGSTDAWAQSRGKARADATQHYKWEDAQGRIHFSDTLPVEALNQGRTIYRNGRVVGQVERALTPEEREEQERLERERLAQEALAQEQQQALELLEQSYPDPQSVKADFAQRKVFLTDRITASQATINQHRRVLLDRLERAAEIELKGKKVPKKLADSIQEAVNVVRHHRLDIEQTNARISKLNEEEARVLHSLGWR